MLARHKLGLIRPALCSLGLALAALSSGCATSEGVADSTGGSGGAGAGASADAGVGGSSGAPDAATTSGGSGGSLEIDAAPPGKPIVGVPQTCKDADTIQSYIGCEYWPTVTLNSSLSEAFEFAVVAANPTKSSAHVKAEKDGIVLGELDVAPGELGTLKLPWVPELKQTRSSPSQPLTSALVKGGAFHVTSSVPIVLYQFNPLEFEKGPPAPTDHPCVIDIDTGACMSWTNDASLLLPTSGLGEDYFTVTRPSFHVGDEINPQFTDWWDYPSFIAITATKPNTHVSVQSSAKVRAGNGIQAMADHSGQSFMLDAGDVLLLTAAELAPDAPAPTGEPCAVMPIGPANYHLCLGTPDYDFTGTRVTSDQPISVIAGHDCTMVPHDKWACDHLEESMLPVKSLGTELVVTAPQASGKPTEAGAVDPTFVRILSGGPKNDVTFDPPSVHAKVTLGEGDMIEVGPISDDFVVRGTNHLLVAQFFTGKNATGFPVKGEVGDPSETLAIPTEQFRKEYTVLAPVTYTYNYLNVFTQLGTSVSVDGVPIPDSEFVPVGGSEFVVARHAVDGGSHDVTSPSGGKLGIVVYGYGNFTSYAYPGGLNLEPVIITPK